MTPCLSHPRLPPGVRLSPLPLVPDQTTKHESDSFNPKSLSSRFLQIKIMLKTQEQTLSGSVGNWNSKFGRFSNFYIKLLLTVPGRTLDQTNEIFILLLMAGRKKLDCGQEVAAFLCSSSCSLVVQESPKTSQRCLLRPLRELVSGLPLLLSSRQQDPWQSLSFARPFSFHQLAQMFKLFLDI